MDLHTACSLDRLLLNSQIKVLVANRVGSQNKSDLVSVTVDKCDLTCLCCDLSSLLLAQVKTTRGNS